MKLVIRLVPTSARWVRRARASPSSGRLSLVVHAVDRRDPARRRLIVAAGKHRRDQLRRIAWRVSCRARSGSRRARPMRSHASFCNPSLAVASSLRIAASRVSRPCRQTPAEAARRRCRQDRQDRSHRRSPNKDRPSTATKRRRARPRSSPTASRCCARQQRRSRLKGAQLRRCGIDQPVGGSSAGSGRKAEAPGGQAYRPDPTRSSPRGRWRRRRRPFRRASDRSRRCARSGGRGRSAPRRLPAPRRATRTLPAPARWIPASYLRMPSSSGHSAGGSALASALWTPTCVIFGVKRSASTPATSIRAASASPSRSSSQARSATQSTGLTFAGACSFASSASRSAICAQREASGVSIRRIRLDRNAPLAAAPRIAGRVRPRLEIGSRPSRSRAVPSRDIRPAAAGGCKLTAAKPPRPRFRPTPPSFELSTAVGGGVTADSARSRRRRRRRLCANSPAGRAPAAPDDRCRRDQEELSAHCPRCGTSTSIVMGRLLLR